MDVLAVFSYVVSDESEYEVSCQKFKDGLCDCEGHESLETKMLN